MRHVCPRCSASGEVASLQLRPLRCKDCGFCPETEAIRNAYEKIGVVVLRAYPLAWWCTVTVLVAITTWMVSDAQFRATVRWTRIDFGVPDDEVGKVLATFPREITEKYHQWSTLGPRIVTLKGAVVLSIASLFIILLRPFARRPSWWTFFGVVTPILGFIALIEASDGLIWWGLQNRVRTQLPRFRMAVEPLLQQWPTASGTLPEAGPFLMSPRFPNKLYLTETDSYSRFESFGTSVERSPRGAVFFELTPPDWNSLVT